MFVIFYPFFAHLSRKTSQIFTILYQKSAIIVIRKGAGAGVLQGIFALLTVAALAAGAARGRLESVMMGSSETVFYTCGVYLSAAGVKKSRHTVPCALLAWLAGSIAAGLLVP